MNFNQIIVLAFGIIGLLYLIVIFWLFKSVYRTVGNKFLKFFFLSSIILLLILIPIGIMYSPIILILDVGFTFILIVTHLLFRSNTGVTYINDSDRLILLDDNLRSCIDCATLNKKEFVFCTNCGNELSLKCTNCDKIIDPLWKHCPFCNEIIHKNINTSKKDTNVTTKIFDKLITKIKSIEPPFKISFQPQKTLVFAERRNDSPAYEIKIKPEDLKK